MEESEKIKRRKARIEKSHFRRQREIERVKEKRKKIRLI